jgi:hypothetical protein
MEGGGGGGGMLRYVAWVVTLKTFSAVMLPHTHIHTYKHIQTHTCTHLQTHTHTHTHTHIHARTRISTASDLEDVLGGDVAAAGMGGLQVVESVPHITLRVVTRLF